MEGMIFFLVPSSVGARSVGLVKDANIKRNC